VGLAVLGVYGVITYSVSRRMHELGIRRALGASTRAILQLVMGDGLALTVIGAVVGIAAAVGLTRFLSTLLYEVSPTDPLTFVVVSLALVGVSLCACYLPARWATKVDPMIALRAD
jgi:ABC-type antimicrobial peptide transport system permease subunit